MSTQRAFPWFWKQRSLLFWNGWLQGGSAVVILVIIPLAALIRPPLWPVAYGLSLSLVLIPHLIGVRRYLADAREDISEQMRSQQELLLEISRMSAAMRAAREYFEEMADRDRHQG
jgi:hypothetical protein